MYAVREPSLARDRGQRASGVIDTLSAGYRIVNQQIWIVLIPIILDLFLWLGPQVSVSPLVGQALTRWRTPTGLTGEQAQSFEEWRRAMLGAADEFNVLQMLSPTPVGVPSMAVLIPGLGPFLLVDSWTTALLVIVGSLLLGLLLGCAYYVLIAQQVRDGAVSAVRSPGHVWLACRRVIGLLLALGAASLVLGLPLAFVLASAMLVSPALASFGLAFVLVAAVWLQFYLFFAPDAIFVSLVGPLQAVKRSVTLVRAHFWPAMLLITLTWVILVGMSQLWVYLASLPGGALLGMLGNAYIASGLVAASMVFYWERVNKHNEGLSIP